MSKWGKHRRSDVHKGLSGRIANTFIEYTFSSSVQKVINPSNIKEIKKEYANLSNSKMSGEGDKQGAERNFQQLVRMQI